jgi:endonuclease YncB( thermonuclease family)
MDAPPAIICHAPRAVDGDTIRCQNIGKAIRLAGIDAPELGGKCRRGKVCAPGDGEASRRTMAALIASAPVTITPAGRDRYGRIIARVTAGRIDVSCEMIRRRQAIPRYGQLDCPTRVKLSWPPAGKQRFKGERGRPANFCPPAFPIADCAALVGRQAKRLAKLSLRHAESLAGGFYFGGGH